MMNERQRAVDYALKRAQASRNCERHLQKLLFSAAKDILARSAKYRTKGKLAREEALLREARGVTARISGDIVRYVNLYASASCSVLGISSGKVGDFLSAPVFGQTTEARTDTYLARFAEDIVRMIKAGSLMGYHDSQLLSALRTGYKNPYRASVVTKAQRKDIDIATPSCGKGHARNAYSDIIRNARQVISLAWGLAEQQYGDENGAVGFRVFRGSSYPCAVCDDECAYTHTMYDPYPPFHVSCVCYAQFIFKKR